MPIIKSAKKAARQATKRTEHNVKIKKDIKSALKTFKANPTQENLAKAQSEYDKAVKKDLLKKNTASRRKAKLYAIAKEAGLKLTKKATEKKAGAKKTQSKAKAEAK
ncbi:30S ribosomal protein S20 [Candidatus Saccharibacteria bacterium]|nr:30S ribosomal protein S20 [Candidatus Saccharibacteria bacterium]MBQ3321064.1 30S ribosomal protein S20 [Candidatus Saccharibacteria bacterium]